MKKLLSLLLFFALKAQGQITITSNNLLSNADGSTFNSGPTLTAGRLYVYIMESSVSGATPNVPTLTVTGNTVTQIASETYNTIASPVCRLMAWRFVAASSGAVTLSTNFSGQTQQGFYGTLYGIDGAVTTGTNGADGIVQVVTSTSDATANPSLTMSAISNSANAIIAAYGNSVPTTFGGTAEAGWNQDANAGHDAGGFFAMHRLTTTDNTPTVTASSSDWAGIAIEIKSVARRRIIID